MLVVFATGVGSLPFLHFMALVMMLLPVLAPSPSVDGAREGALSDSEPTGAPEAHCCGSAGLLRKTGAEPGDT